MQSIPSRLPARSPHGCWTCRARRKKCDENHPSCSTCASLELECHGYGPKPAWMDNGILQKEQILCIKRSMHSKSKKRRPWLLGITQSVQDLVPGLDPLRLEKYPLATGAMLSSTRGTVVVPDGRSSRDDLQISEKDLNVLNELSAYPFPNSAAATENRDVESHSLSSSGSFEQRPPSNLTSPSNYDASAIEANGVPRQGIRSEANEGALIAFDEATSRATYHVSQFSRGPTFTSQPDIASSFQKYSSTNSEPFSRFSSWPKGPRESILCGATDDVLLMNYLDQVFYLQYPFYRFSDGRGRGWLFSILRRVKSVYHATLALSEHHQQSTLPGNGSITSCLQHLRAKGGHYDLALQEMQLSIGESHTWNGAAGLVRSIETLTGILQLLFWELFSGGTGYWRMHLRAAGTLVPALAQTQTAPITPSSTDLNRDKGQQCQSAWLSEDDAAIRFLLGSFISFDIISCASTRSRPLLNLDHSLILQRAEIHLESFVGCRNWALILILEISLLDSWKKDAEDAHRLSIVELARRGSQIEERLREKLADIDEKPLTATSSVHTFGVGSASTQTQITKIFALSAMTYLHVVISGAYPELPEIAESVSKTIAAFKSLTDTTLLRNLVWPFCISGCLALDGQQDFFRDLMSGAEITPLTVGTCAEAFKIILECWDTRRTCSRGCDWVFIMNKLGYHVLLK